MKDKSAYRFVILGTVALFEGPVGVWLSDMSEIPRSGACII